MTTSIPRATDPPRNVATTLYNPTYITSVDEQIQALSKEVVRVYNQGFVSALVKLDPLSPQLDSGTAVALKGGTTQDLLVAATAANIAAGAILIGALAKAAAPGDQALVAVGGLLDATVAKLTGTGNFVRANAATGALERVVAFAGGDVQVGVARADGAVIVSPQVVTAVAAGAVTGVGDWTGPSNANIVGQASGVGGKFAVLCAAVAFAAGVVSPTIQQDIRTDAAAGQSITLAAQAPKGGAGGNGGSVYVEATAGDGAGVAGSAYARGNQVYAQSVAGTNYNIFDSTGQTFYATGTLIGSSTLASSYWRFAPTVALNGLNLDASANTAGQVLITGGGTTGIIYVTSPTTNFRDGGGASLGVFTNAGNRWSSTADTARAGISLSATGSGQLIQLQTTGLNGDMYVDFARTLHFRDPTQNDVLQFTGWAYNGVGTINVGEQVTFAMTQTARGTDAATHDFLIQPQRAFATATLTNRKAADFVVDLGPPTNGGAPEARLTVKRNGVFSASLGPYEGGGGSTFSAIYLGPGVTPGQTNFAFLSDGAGTTYLNTTVGGSITLAFGGSSGNAGSVVFQPGLWTWSALTVIPTISQAQMTGDNPTNALVLQPQFASSTSTLTNRTAGSLVINVGAPNTGGTVEARTYWQRNGTPIAALSSYDAAIGNTALWMGSGIAPSSANYTIAGDGSTASYLNAPTANSSVAFQAAGVSQFTLWGGTQLTGVTGGFVMQMNNITGAPTGTPTSSVWEYASGGEKWGRTPNGVLSKVIPDGDTGFIDQTGFYKVSTTGATTGTKDYDTSARGCPASSIMFFKVWVASYDTTNVGQEEWVFEGAVTNIGGALLLLGVDQIGTTHSHGTVLAITPTVTVTGTNIRVTVGGSQVGAVIHHIVRFQVGAAAP